MIWRQHHKHSLWLEYNSKKVAIRSSISELFKCRKISLCVNEQALNSFAGPSETTHILLAIIFISVLVFHCRNFLYCNLQHVIRATAQKISPLIDYGDLVIPATFNFLRKQGDSRNFKSVSTRAPESRATCHPTDFSETLSVWRIYPKLKATNWFLFWLFPGGDRPSPIFLVIT